jgi:hypothetical protein
VDLNAKMILYNTKMAKSQCIGIRNGVLPDKNSRREPYRIIPVQGCTGERRDGGGRSKQDVYDWNPNPPCSEVIVYLPHSNTPGCLTL